MFNSSPNLALLYLVTTVAVAKPVPWDHSAHSLSVNLAAVSPTTNNSNGSTPLSSGDQACVRVRDLSVPQLEADPDSYPVVPADLAYECLNALAFNQTASRLLLESLKPYLGFQTTLSYVAEPPAEYAAKVRPPYDFWGNFERISLNVEAGTYVNEHAFALDLFSLFTNTADGHFQYMPDALSGPFLFSRPHALISASEDGQSLPQIYFVNDILATTSGNSSFTPSPITHIDGADVVEFLVDISSKANLFHDEDALWNSLFYRSASIAGDNDGTGQFTGTQFAQLVYPGASNTFDFANGSSITYQNSANVLGNFSDISNAADLYKKYFALSGNMTATAPEIAKSDPEPDSDESPTDPSDPPPGYPQAFARESTNAVAGYFIEQSGYEDVAVLSIPSFYTDNQDEFQDVVRQFLAGAVAGKKTKLILDLSSNFGGSVEQVGDVFEQLFPIRHPSATHSLFAQARFRMNDDINHLGQSISEISGQYPRSNDIASDEIFNAVYSDYNYRTLLKPNGKNFESWKEIAGPYQHGPSGDTFSHNTLEYNPLDPLNNLQISGFGNLTNVTTHRPFKPENIVLLTDVVCASGCVAFVESLKYTHGIKTVAVGGIPDFNPIQATGGTAGYLVTSMKAILNRVTTCFRYGSNTDFLETTGLAKFSTTFYYRSFFSSVVNSRDAIRKEDPTQTPLQFSYKEADCRLFYTPEMTLDQEAIWKTVADSSWGTENHCIAGSGLGKRDMRPATKKHGISKRSDIILGHKKVMQKPYSLPKAFNKDRLRDFK